MSSRTTLLAALTTSLSTSTAITVSAELPWSQNGQPLYLKNLKKLYVDYPQVEESILIDTLDDCSVIQNDVTITAYAAVDAKNPPAQLDSAISRILSAKDSTGLVNFGTESDYSTQEIEDVLVLTFEYRINTIK